MTTTTRYATTTSEPTAAQNAVAEALAALSDREREQFVHSLVMGAVQGAQLGGRLAEMLGAFLGIWGIHLVVVDEEGVHARSSFDPKHEERARPVLDVISDAVTAAMDRHMERLEVERSG